MVGFLRLIVLLPYTWQLTLGKALGLLAFKVMSKRRRIAKINIDLCFPEKSEQERTRILKGSFENLGMGVMEGLIAWFMSERRFSKIPITWRGTEIYKAALKEGRGVILLSGHFPCLELIGRKMSQIYPYTAAFKRSHHPFFEYLITNRRKRYINKLINHTNVRGMVDSLRAHETFWYAPDQDFGPKVSIFCPWFGISTATVTATTMLAKYSKAIVIPAYFRRLPKGGYEGTALPPLENFPSGDLQVDCNLWQKSLEDFIRKHPEQYLWIHKRFKTRPEGEPSFYN